MGLPNRVVRTYKQLFNCPRNYASLNEFFFGSMKQAIAFYFFDYRDSCHTCILDEYDI